MKTITNIVLLALLAACGGGGSGGSDRILTEDTTSPQNTTGSSGPSDAQPTVDEPRAFPYVADGRYADILWDCSASWAFAPCSFADFPLIGQETDDPEIDDIMARVLVAESWMGDNFRFALERMPRETLQLFRSTTAVVITDDYDGGLFFLGKLYLGAIFLWLTPEQRADLHDGPRGTQADDGLAFRMPRRYVKDGMTLSLTGPDSGTRDPDQMVAAFASLLFHELAHAAAWAPPDVFADATTPESVVTTVVDDWVGTYPIQPGADVAELRLYQLAQVRFGVETATAEQQDIQPVDLVSEFANQSALVFYAYTDPDEDFATAVAAAAMSFHFGYRQDTGITGNTTGASNDELLVWGQRGRIGEHHINGRVRAAVQAVYPEGSGSIIDYLAGLPPASQLVTGITWGESAGSTQ